MTALGLTPILWPMDSAKSGAIASAPQGIQPGAGAPAAANTSRPSGRGGSGSSEAASLARSASTLMQPAQRARSSEGRPHAQRPPVKAASLGLARMSTDYFNVLHEALFTLLSTALTHPRSAFR